MTSLAEAFGLGRGCFGREGVLRCTGTFPESHRSPFVGYAQNTLAGLGHRNAEMATQNIGRVPSVRLKVYTAIEPQEHGAYNARHLRE